MKSQILLSFGNKVADDTISKYNQLKQEFDNNKCNQNITNKELDDMFTGLKEFKEINKKTNSAVDEALIKNKRTKVQYIIAILLRSTLVDNKEQARFEKHYGFKQEDITIEIESFLLMKISKAIAEFMTNPTTRSERLLYPNLSTVNEQYINEKVQANNKFNININIMKDIRNYQLH